jgi:uncharacterized protein with HEPN domain
MSRSIQLYLNDILNSIRKIKQYTSQKTQSEFLEDEQVFDAVVYNLQIIGEATRKIPEEIRSRQPQMEWKNIIGIRNIITHAYFAIDDEVVWDIIQTKLDPLQSCIQQILETEDLENY